MRSLLSLLALAALLAAPAAAHAQNAPVTVSVDAAANRHAIDPRVYGVHFASTAALLDLNATINRYGGNSSGRYNWLGNIDNRGGDYFFYSFPYSPRTSGAFMDEFIQRTKNGAAEPFLTMPMVGSVSKADGNNTLWSFSVAECGPQSAADGDAGNGCIAGGKVEDQDPCPDGSRKMTPLDYPPMCDPVNAASIPADHSFQQPWVQQIRNTFGLASAGGLKYWGLDNEPTIWHNAYWDVHPSGATTDEMRDKMFAYGAMIKGVDPGVQVLGPEEWGWDGYFYSGRDQQLISGGDCFGANCPDRLSHAAADGNRDYIPYLLDRLKNYQDTHAGQRILDMLTLHFYPTGREYNFDNGNDVTQATQLLRNRSTRALWDPSYVDEYWIATQVKLIPRMKDWVNTYYPGTKIGLTEYNWGAENHINGATAQADLLGIFGRENLDMAIRWEVPPGGSHVYNAFKMYRNYDGAKSSFGDTSVLASAPNPDELAAFAAQRSASDALTVMVINKVLTGNTPTTVNLASFNASGSAEVWRLTSTNVITHLANVPVVGNSFSASLPPQSITLFVVPKAPEALPSLSINDVSVSEGNVGTTSASFTVSLSSASAQTVTVNYATADGTASAPSDYVAIPSTMLTFTPGETSKTVTVTVNGDTTFEPNETFFVNLSGPANATIADGQGQGTINNDDSQPSISINDVTVTEGNAGTTPAVFTVSLSNPSSQTITVTYAGADGTATTADNDYVAVPSTVLTFNPGDTAKTATVTVNGDTNVEPNETFFVNLDGATSATIADNQGQGTISNDDVPPSTFLLLGQRASKMLASGGEQRYAVSLVAGRSYIAFCWQPKVEGGGNCGVEVRNDGGTPVSQPANGEPAMIAGGHVGDSDSVIPAATGSDLLALRNNLGGTAETHVAIVETTLFSPWYFVAPGSGYNGFIEIRNSTNHTATGVVVTAFRDDGTVAGSSTISIPADGTALVTASALNPNGFGSVQIAHREMPGSVTANITTLSAATGLSFDAPFSARMSWIVRPR
jgi:hypothetical protein